MYRCVKTSCPILYRWKRGNSPSVDYCKYGVELQLKLKNIEPKLTLSKETTIKYIFFGHRSIKEWICVCVWASLCCNVRLTQEQETWRCGYKEVKGTPHRMRQDQYVSYYLRLLGKESVTIQQFTLDSPSSYKVSQSRFLNLSIVSCFSNICLLDDN